MDVVVNPGWHAELVPHIDAFGDRLAGNIADDAQRFAPFDTGRLESSIVHYQVGARRWRIHAKAPYAAYVELGTGPHLILPKRKRALHWPGADHPVKRVNHPGTPAQPYLRPALTAARG